jgi:hypothetical protein
MHVLKYFQMLIKKMLLKRVIIKVYKHDWQTFGDSRDLL